MNRTIFPLKWVINPALPDKIVEKIINEIRYIENRIKDYIPATVDRKQISDIVYDIYTKNAKETIPYICDEFIKVVKYPMEDMPLYINSGGIIEDTAIWRLKNAI
jgi:hypothetical protein